MTTWQNTISQRDLTLLLLLVHCFQNIYKLIKVHKREIQKITIKNKKIQVFIIQNIQSIPKDYYTRQPKAPFFILTNTKTFIYNEEIFC